MKRNFIVKNYRNEDGLSEFYTEEAIENYKETVKKCLNGEFKRIN